MKKKRATSFSSFLLLLLLLLPPSSFSFFRLRMSDKLVRKALDLLPKVQDPDVAQDVAWKKKKQQPEKQQKLAKKPGNAASIQESKQKLQNKTALTRLSTWDLASFL